MGRIVNFATQLHKSTKRNYIERMQDDKIACMKTAKEYGYDYWDGDRRYGYGGYTYDGRWSAVAKMMIDYYDLKNGCKILDAGCGKAFLLYEFTRLLPDCEIVGFDISKHGLRSAKKEIRDRLFQYKVQDIYPFGDKEFDLVISLTTLHNLKIFELKNALQEIERVGKNRYVLVESYRDENELFNLECWALTCESFFRPEEWIWLYREFGYNGDYEFIYF